MFGIRNLTLSRMEHDGFGQAVHGFYRDSFAALYKIDSSSVSGECGYLTRHADFIVPLLKAASRGFGDKINFFYDIRNSEEYEQPSPDYALLSRVGLNHVSPLCIRDKEGASLITALQIARFDAVGDDEPVLFCCSEMFTRYDKDFDGSLKACAFLLFPNAEGAEYTLEVTDNSCVQRSGLTEPFFALSEGMTKEVCAEYSLGGIMLRKRDEQ
ncbi:MAG: hypothetical protein IJS28_00530 [Synergistaceae bacterium]|nr:hypothetical protein [Synergistaceae bacterium]